MNDTEERVVRLPLPANLKSSVVFRLENGPDGWRASSTLNRPGFRWEIAAPADQTGSASEAAALRLAVGEMIDRLLRLSLSGRVRERLAAHLREFAETLTDEESPGTPPVHAAAEEPSSAGVPALKKPARPRRRHRSPQAAVLVPPPVPESTPRLSPRLARRRAVAAALALGLRRFWSGRERGGGLLPLPGR